MKAPDLWRTADEHDEDLLREVWALTYGSQFESLPPDVAQALCRHQFDAQRDHYARAYPELTNHVLRQGGFDVGRVLLWEQPGQVRILDLGVLPQHQRKGVGRAVLERVQALAGSRTVGLAVEKNRPHAQRLYERVGFVPTRETDTHVFMEWRRGS